MEVYLSHNDQRSGPHTTAEVQAMIAASKIDRSCLAWREGMPDWLPLEEVVTLSASSSLPPFPAGLPPVPARITTNSVLKEKVDDLQKRLAATNFCLLIARHERRFGPVIGLILIIAMKFACHHGR